MSMNFKYILYKSYSSAYLIACPNKQSLRSWYTVNFIWSGKSHKFPFEFSILNINFVIIFKKRGAKMESIHVCEFVLLTTQWYRYFPVHFGKHARKVEINLYMHVSWFPLSYRRNSKSFLSRDTCTTPNMNPVLAVWAYILTIPFYTLDWCITPLLFLLQFSIRR